MPRTKPAPQAKRLTHDDMCKVIDEGGSVLHASSIITDKDDLPTDAELAETIDEKHAATTAIDEQISALQAQKTRMMRQTDVTAQKTGTPGPEKPPQPNPPQPTQPPPKPPTPPTTPPGAFGTKP